VSPAVNLGFLSEKICARINDWLINTPYWAVDIFAPGYSTKHLRNDPVANGLTIDYDLTPYNGNVDTVVVADIPEEYREVYNEFISGERKTDPEATIKVSNLVRAKDYLKFDYYATGNFEVKFDKYGDYYNFQSVDVYGVTTDKQTGEIIRYDHVTAIGVSQLRGYVDAEKIGKKINFPEDFDPEKHEYGFCFLVFGYNDGSEWVYEGDGYIYNYTKVEVPAKTPSGDANADGAVNMLDLTSINRKLVGGKVDFPGDADLTCDGLVGLSDISTFRRLLSASGNDSE